MVFRMEEKKKRTKHFLAQIPPCQKLRALKCFYQGKVSFQDKHHSPSGFSLPLPGDQQGTDHARLITILLCALNVALWNMIMTVVKRGSHWPFLWSPADKGAAGPLRAGCWCRGRVKSSINSPSLECWMISVVKRE